jgi:hypothetical protein
VTRMDLGHHLGTAWQRQRPLPAALLGRELASYTARGDDLRPLSPAATRRHQTCPTDAALYRHREWHAGRLPVQHAVPPFAAATPAPTAPIPVDSKRMGMGHDDPDANDCHGGARSTSARNSSSIHCCKTASLQMGTRMYSAAPSTCLVDSTPGVSKLERSSPARDTCGRALHPF